MVSDPAARRYHRIMGWRRIALTAGRRLGAYRLLEGFYGRSRLTVLAYHRVTDPDAAGFVGYRGNVSATPDEFDAQMAWIAERMNPVSIEQLAASLHGPALPDRAVLVTFDDGYRDNLVEAAPIMQPYDIPSVIFLATDHIGTAHPLWWDLVAWRFTTSTVREADLPLTGPTSWTSPDQMASRWIAAAKQLPDEDRRVAVASLAGALGGGDPTAAFSEVLLTWADVTTLEGHGWSIGAHTCSHPILTRVDDPATVLREVGDSVDRVAVATGGPVLGFAYPNGQAGDFDAMAKEAVASAGVPLAFTLLPGPARPHEVRSDPLGIRRVYVHHGDDPTRFAAKVAGVPRLIGLP